MDKNRTVDSRSMSELLSDLKRETAELVRDEVQLARAELAEKAQRIKRGAAALAIGGVLAFAGLLVLLAAAVLLLNLALESAWLSSLIVAFVVLLAGMGFLAAGRSRLNKLSPEETTRSLRQDKKLVERHVGQRTAGESSR